MKITIMKLIFKNIGLKILNENFEKNYQVKN